MTIGGVIGAKSANEGDSVQPRERGDFELEPVEGDGSIQSIASDSICTNPVGDGDGDQSGMLRNVQGQDIKCDLLYLAALLTIQVASMLLNKEESYEVTRMLQQFGWIHWNDGAFTELLIGQLFWGWFRVMNVYRWVLRLGLPRKKKKKKRQCRRNWRNGTKEFNRRKLPYHLVRRCCCRRERLGQRPPRHDGNRLPSLGLNRRWRRMKKRQRCNQTRKEEQSASETQMWEFIEFCELSRPKPRHVDAPVWESLLNWLCFESPCSDDFPANRRVHADPIVKTNDKLASRLKEFIEEEEDHDVNVTRLLSRAAEQKAGGPEQKRNSHQHNKSRFRSVLSPFIQRVLHASGRTTLTCERYHGGTIYAVGCSDYIWTVDEKLEMLLPTATDYGYAKVDEDGD